MTPSVSLPVVDTFTPAYKVWETRPATLEEMIANGSPDDVKVNLKETISDARAAAEYMARVGSDNKLSNYIEAALNKSAAYKEWQKAMPSSTPNEISRYQKNYQKSKSFKVSNEIEQKGAFLSTGQFLFHGGLWSQVSSFVTERPLSTSLCPQVALRNAELQGKAYDAGRLDLFVLYITTPNTKAFVFKHKGTSLGHESEVLLASGVSLTLKTQTLIRRDYPVAIYLKPSKEISIFVLEVEVS